LGRVPEIDPGDGRPRIWYETRGDASDDPVVLLHGFTGTHRTWDRLSERLAQGRFLVLPDLPGHGRSGTSSSRLEMGVRPTSGAIAEVMRVAAGVGGKRKAALLGYSLGGRVALDLACKRQELLSCVILEGASPGIERDDEREERRAKDDALADEIERRGLGWFVDYWQDTALFATQKRLPPAAFQGVRLDRLSNSARGLAMSLRGAGAGEMAPLWRAIERLRIPVLLVVGKGDRRYADIGEVMRRRIPGSLLAEVEGAGHCPHLEKPEEFADLVERFLEDNSATIRAAEERAEA
jgi:2-succinyl-6-hydroxy-2,4-cyclohexadiene-1-carboxylate synthase